MSPDERITSLAVVAEFRGIAPQALAMLAAAMREERFVKGEMIIAAGEVGDRVFVLCQGELEVTQPELAGRVQRLGRGALLGELAFFAGKTRTATVRAAADSVLLSLPYTNFRDFLLTHPESSLILTERLVRKLLNAEEELAAAVGGTNHFRDP